MFASINPKEYKVSLLSGGTSSEREISIKSGDGAQEALEEAGFTVERLDPAKPEDLKRLIGNEFDVAFLCTHGRGGEDGSLQGFLETINMPYTGSGVFGSAVCMDKAKAKIIYSAEDIPTPHGLTIRSNMDLYIEDVLDGLGFTDHQAAKCVVKAAHEGSSVGVYIAEGPEDIEQAIKDAFKYDDLVVVERYVAGREFTVVVLGDGDEAQALPIIEIVPKNESYDFESKYAPGGSKHICPADLPPAITDRMQCDALLAHEVLECGGVSRTDFILDDEGREWALETNTLPGMTATSLLPDAARAAGISFPEVCTEMIVCALNRAKNNSF